MSNKVYFTHHFSVDRNLKKVWSLWVIPGFWQTTWETIVTHIDLDFPIKLGSKGMVSFSNLGAWQLQIVEFQENEKITIQFRSHSARFNLHYLLEPSLHQVIHSSTKSTQVKVSLTLEYPAGPSDLVSKLIKSAIQPHLVSLQDRLQYANASTQSSQDDSLLTIDDVDKSNTSINQSDEISGHSSRLPSLGYSLWQMSNRWQSEVRASLKHHGLTTTQWLILFMLVRMEKDNLIITPTLISKALSLNTMLVSDVVKSLVSKHLVHKIKILPDRRSFKISATPSGKIVAVEAHTDVILAEKRFFRDLSLDERPVVKYLDLIKQQIVTQTEKSKHKQGVS